MFQPMKLLIGHYRSRLMKKNKYRWREMKDEKPKSCEMIVSYIKDYEDDPDYEIVIENGDK